MKPIITDIPGIAGYGAELLAGRGIRTVAQLGNSTIGQLTEIRGFGIARATKAINGARALLAGAQKTPDKPESAEVEGGGKKSTKKSRDKSKRKKEKMMAKDKNKDKKKDKKKDTKKGKKGKKGKKKK